jgi:hypothetical protein
MPHQVVLSRLPSVVYEAQAASLDLAIDRALAGVERAVRRTLLRQRTRPSQAAARAQR